MEPFTDFMMRAGVLSFGDFTLKSGRKSPYFLNAGMYRDGEQIFKLGQYYARMIVESGEEFDALFGPAYKGIPLVTAVAMSLYRDYWRNYPYFFNRKEAKDHGEGGILVGYTPKDGDRIAIIEDVVSAGTAVRESLTILKNAADVRVTSLFVSVDRCERGTGGKTALDELRDEYGISVHAIITAREIINELPEGDERRAAMEDYLARYGA